MKFVVKNFIPKVNRARRANVKPERCGPNLLLRTNLDSDLHDVVHDFQGGEVGWMPRPLERQTWRGHWSSWAMRSGIGLVGCWRLGGR